jgi:hypothetical protein
MTSYEYGTWFVVINGALYSWQKVDYRHFPARTFFLFRTLSSGIHPTWGSVTGRGGRVTVADRGRRAARAPL